MSKEYHYDGAPVFADSQIMADFNNDLCRPMHAKMPEGWGNREIPADKNVLNLSGGITLVADFPDDNGYLETAYADFKDFLSVAGLEGEKYPLRIVYQKTQQHETHTISVTQGGITLSAGDTDGIRRGLVWIEDEICRWGGPYLPIGELTRHAVVRTRISRCFYGPIKRPPFNRDELSDDINYYPDGYLNRLAHDGTNGLWLTISLRELLPSKVVPEFNPGEEGKRKLEKLRRTVQQCLRYGIRIYAFMIEPRGLHISDPAALNNPDIRGMREGDEYGFCTSSEQGKAYLREAFSELFRQVPGLGGVINITAGERLTHCWSVFTRKNRPAKWNGVECPRCKDLDPVAVQQENLKIMAEAIHSVAPDAEFISWPYNQGIWTGEESLDSAGCTPDGVCHCYNFESSGLHEQLGKTQFAGDYWLSYVGPSALFQNMADRVTRNPNARMFAKIQVGCSHEVATVPFVPVPSKLYEKYKAMHETGVSGVMQCWYFGSYPSPMTKAAGELAFAPFPKSEDDFLLSLASIRWGTNAPAVVRAWKLFAQGYSNYPLNAVMGYYGPMHDGPTWPLYLEPANLPLSPSWKLTHPNSGDRIGECFYYTHTMNEILYLTGEMSRLFHEGDAILETLEDAYRNDPDCAGDLRVCRALTLQFASAYHIFRFYDLRENMAFGRNVDRLANLRIMKDIAVREREISVELSQLCQQDMRLGFHSEAEGYKYNSDKLNWRIAQLDELLAVDFPALEKRLKAGEYPFPEYQGKSDEYKSYHAPYRKNTNHVWDSVPVACDFIRDENLMEDSSTSWQAFYDDKNLYVRIVCEGGDIRDTVQLKMEPRSLWWYPPTKVWRDGHWEPIAKVHYHQYFGLKDDDLKREVTIKELENGWECTIQVSLATIARDDTRFPLRINIVRNRQDVEDVCCPDVVVSAARQPGGCYKWVRRDPILPQYPRLIYSDQNTQEAGYLIFDEV